MKKNEIIEKIKENDIKILRFLYLDNDGIIRGYSSQRESMEDALENGYCIASGMAFFTAFDKLVENSEFGPIGEFRIIPDLSTFKILPYANKSAAIITDIKTQTLEDSGICSRSLLKRVISNSQYDYVAAFENEFYLLQMDENNKLIPADNSLCYSTKGMDKMNDISVEILEALEKQNIVIEKYHPEYGPGQQEYCLKYDDALKIADKQTYFKETVRAIADQYGLTASFMPKPFQQFAGSGSHINISLWKDGKNVFYDNTDTHSLSKTAYYFVGGILKHLKAICAFTASTVNSYKRLVPHNWASAYTCYGFNNREAAVRVPSTYFNKHANQSSSARVEIKPADPACNPYLALSAIIAAGLDGIKNEIQPGDPVLVDPAELSVKERQTKNIDFLPRTLNEAINHLDKNKMFRESFGDKMIDEYIKMKKQDWTDFINQVSEWEFEKYVDIF